jgi:hypothetical protein
MLATITQALTQSLRLVQLLAVRSLAHGKFALNFNGSRCGNTTIEIWCQTYVRAVQTVGQHHR